MRKGIIMTENDVIERMSRFFTRAGRIIIGRAFNNSAGVDLAVRLGNGRQLFIEAKGNKDPAHTRGRCQAIWDSGYARLPQLAAGRKRIRHLDGRRDRNPTLPDAVGLAVPDNAFFREQSEWFLDHMRHSGFGLWFVGPRRVRQVLNPRIRQGRRR